MAVCAVSGSLFVAAPALAADRPTLLLLPLDIVDTSGETPSRSKEHEARLVTLTRYLSEALEADGDYFIVDSAPIRAEIDKASIVRFAECNGCELDLARLVHADRVLVGEVNKVSTLIGSLHISIVNVVTGERVFSRVLGFRGDTDEAWHRAARFFVRDLAAVGPQQR